MDRRKLKPVYLGAIALNAIAFVYAIDIGEYLFAVTFVFILVYLAYRYRSIPDG